MLKLDQPIDELNQFMVYGSASRGCLSTRRVSNGSVFGVACFATFADRASAQATHSLTQWLVVEQLVHKSSLRASVVSEWPGRAHALALVRPSESGLVELTPSPSCVPPPPTSLSLSPAHLRS